ncbi:hypothetical protein ACFFV7_17275 [Nonomuraea spiralis]|uniref:Uncharacterized protein n=1 Tax=Nonomuraea spiralis TaxID=46182 RepID=A0ABV5IFT6_9ACTN|nr:hypothetical protein [Nonomuraea spiralis]
MTGDVLSPRWSTEDTDEQPAIQVSGNGTYILPADKGAQPAEPAHDVLDAPSGSHDVLDGGLSGPHDVLGGVSGAHDVLDGASGPHETLSGSHEALSGPHETLGSLSGPHAVLGAESFDATAGERAAGDDDLPYLPLDQGYEPDRDDDADRTRRGFLGSGWTEDSDDRRGSGGERQVRRRTRVLVLAAAAVVLVGVGAGWLLTGTSADDPCAAGRCAGASEVSAPAETAAPEETEEVVPEPTDTDTAEPTVSETVTPTPVVHRARPTREPSVRPTTPARESRPTDTPEGKTTHGPRGEMNDTSDGAPEDAGRPAATKQPEQEDSAPTQAPPPSQQPQQPDPAPSEKKGLFDILFPWA